MAMTGKDVQKAAESFIGDSINDSVALAAVNKALRTISDLGLVYDSMTVEVKSRNEWHDLPSYYTSVIKVEREEDGEPYNDCEDMGGRIRFRDPGTYIVYYRKIPRLLESLSDELVINEGFYNTIENFVIQYALRSKSKEPADKINTNLLQDFEKELIKTYGYLRKRRYPKQVKVIRHA